MTNESQNIEFKESWRDEYLKWICGFANAQGGSIFIGVNDKKEVVGVENSKKLMEDIPNKVRDVLGIVVDVNLHEEDGKDYLGPSYFAGAVPANDYTPASPWAITVEAQVHSRDQLSEGYIKLFVASGGADSPRGVTLRTKPSTGEWFIWEFSSVLSGIRAPLAKDDWA